MNFDELETRLGNVPRAPIPAGWRKELLSVGESHNSSLQRSPWWKQWLWPHPAAWAGLAAVWVVILAVEFAAHSEPADVSAGLVRPAPEMLQAFQDRTRLMAELSDDSLPTPPWHPAAERPRSSRRGKEIVV
jgi:hypothetical protein